MFNKLPHYFIFILSFIFWSISVKAGTITISSSTNWSSITTGSGLNGLPSVEDTITVQNRSTLTVDVSDAVCAEIQLGGNNGFLSTGTLLFNDASQVAVNGIVIIGNSGGFINRGVIDMSKGGIIICKGLKENTIFNQLTPGNGTINLTGINTLQLVWITTFNNLIISANTTLSRNLTINGDLSFNGGNLYTGNNTLTLNTAGTISNESSGSYLIGNLTVTRDISTSESFGGIGVTISTSAWNGVTVQRISGPNGVVTVNGFSGISREWIITSSNPAPSVNTVSFNWVDNDNNGVNPNNAILYSSPDGNTSNPWTPKGAPQSRPLISANITSSDVYWTASDPAHPLPVEITTFTAKVEKNNITLKWITATEVKNFGWEVERSQNNNDWTKVGFVQGSGNSNSPKNYNFTDKDLASGKYIYRLKQIDTDGGSSYSNKLEVNINSEVNGYILEQNYPNPFNPSTIIKFKFAEKTKATLKVYDALGKEVAELFNEIAEPQKEYSVNFNGADLPSGVYFYKIESSSKTVVKKMMLLK